MRAMKIICNKYWEVCPFSDQTLGAGINIDPQGTAVNQMSLPFEYLLECKHGHVTVNTGVRVRGEERGWEVM